MSVQIFLRGKLLGIEDFLVSPSASANAAFIGRSHWIGLLTEVLPRALLAELGLSKLLLGTSGGDQFLLVMPSEFRERAESFLHDAARDIAALSADAVGLVWAITENLGDWSDIRKRLNEQLSLKRGAPLADGSFFSIEAANSSAHPDDSYFEDLAAQLDSGAAIVAWSPERPARVLTGEAKHAWPVDGGAESILFARHKAPAGESNPGRWGVLRGDVDNFGIRLRRLQTIEEHLQLSMTYKQFFAGELKLLCSMGDFWRKVNILYSGGADFAVYGAWDALLPLAREIQRVFRRFAEENLNELPGPDGKTVTMALALAPELGTPLSSVYELAGHHLDLAKSEHKDCMFALGRILDWKQLADAAELKDDLTTLVTKFGASPEYLDELCGLYRETAVTRSSRRSRATERPWRFHLKLEKILPAVRGREAQKMRQDVITGFLGKNAANVKLRPGGRVALEWARLLTESQNN